MVNAIQFHASLEDADYYNQFLNSNLTGLSTFVANIVNGEFPPFICDVGSTVGDAFTVDIAAVFLDTVEVDLAALTISRAKVDSNRLVVHAATETISSFGNGAFYIRITATDGGTTVVRYSDILCSNTQESGTFNVLDNGYNDPLTTAITVIDSGFNTVA